MIIELMDGPLRGYLHEVESGFSLPNAIAIVNELDELRHWYSVDDAGGHGRGFFIRSESV